MDQVLLEIWGRRFPTMEGRRVAADQADIFQAFLRIAAPALEALLALVIEGIYLEPRPAASDHGDQANGASKPSTGSVTSKRMDFLRDQLSSELHQHLNDQITGDTYSTENEQRFAKLETGMAELQAQGHQFRQWFEDSGNKMAAHDQQLSQIQGAIAQQQQDLTSVRAEVHSSAENLHQAMELSCGNELNQELGNTISSHMDRLESFMTEKKA